MKIRINCNVKELIVRDIDNILRNCPEVIETEKIDISVQNMSFHDDYLFDLLGSVCDNQTRGMDPEEIEREIVKTIETFQKESIKFIQKINYVRQLC